MLFEGNDSLLVSAWDLANKEIPDDFFIIKPAFLQRGGRLIYASPTETGKSWLCASFIRSLTLGEPLFGNPEWPVVKSKVVLVESEVGIPLGKRLKQVFHDCPENLKEVGVLSRPQGFALNYPACQVWLREQIKKHEIDVLILDPVNDLHTMAENDNSETNKLLQIIADIQGAETAVIMSHHTSKEPRGQYADGFDPLDMQNARGASKLNNSVDTFLMLHRRPGRLNESLAEDSWVLDARWAKIRHAERKPTQGVINFNGDGNHQMIWHDKNKKSSTPNAVPWSL